MKTNWAGNVAFNASRYHQPTSIAELQRLVAKAKRVKAVGTGHSFNHLADTSGELISLAGLPRTMDIDAASSTVTVAAGMRYGELAVHLHAAGYALHNLGSLPHLSVAGACATGTHGSGDGNANLATAVSALDMVMAGGEILTLTRKDERFPGAVVALGALGVVTSLTLDLVPTFEVKQYVYEDLPQFELKTFESAYSASMFTDWSSSRINQLWLKRLATDPRPSWAGANAADGPRHPIPGMPTANCTEQLGASGPWHERLPHFRLEHTPSSGEELQSEYLVPRRHAGEAFAAVNAIRDRVAEVLQVSEIRTVAADELWLSPSYRQNSIAFHFTWIKDARAVSSVLVALEDQLAPFRARPHWGKLFSTSPDVLSGLYERYSDFRRLMDAFDPEGKLRNDFLDRYLAGTPE